MEIVRRIRNKYFYLRALFLGKYYPKILANELYIESTHIQKGIDWNNPRNINEKINWLKFYSDTSEWTRLADKYKVREYIREKGLNDILVTLYGVWNSARDIDFESLPNSFVLKLNNGCGTVWIVRDKNREDLELLRKKVRKACKEKFGYLRAEPHYSKIPLKIIAEELLEEDSDISRSLIDYKIWCFNGQVFGTYNCYDRKGFEIFTEWHDLTWKHRPEWSVVTSHCKDGRGRVPRPSNYERMLEIASLLSEGFPQVRVDLYNIKGKIYFGEMTFTSSGGYMDYLSDVANNEMGALTKISNESVS